MRVLACAAALAAVAVVIDLLGAWLWFSHIHDGPEFPY